MDVYPIVEAFNKIKISTPVACSWHRIVDEIPDLDSMQGYIRNAEPAKIGPTFNPHSQETLMNPRTQLIMWTSILLALLIILLDKLYEGPPSVIKDRDTLAGIGQEEIGLAGAFSEGPQIRDSADLNQKSSVEYESQFESPPITRAVSHDSTHIYVIQEYDTLGKIAQQYNLDVATLLRFNEIRDPDKIHTGQKLHIPLQQDI